MVELNNVPAIVEPLPAAPPLTPVVVMGADQLYVVPTGTMPFTPLVGDTVNATPSQTTRVIAVIATTGFSVTVNWNDVPFPHATVFGVIVYVALCAVFVELNKVPVMFDAPAPDKPPLTPTVVIGADQLYVVPNGTIPLIPFVGEARNATPLHVIVLIDVIFTRGLRVSVNWNDAPVQPLVNGITVYVALCAVLVGLVRLPLILVCVNAAAPPVTPPVTIGVDQL